MSAKSALKERMQTATAPSMVPSGIDLPAPPPKEVEVIPELRKLITNPADRIKVVALVKDFSARKLQEADALIRIWVDRGVEKPNVKKAKDGMSNKIKAFLGKWSVGLAMCDGVRVNYYNAPRKSIKGDLLTTSLLKHGIAPATIQLILAESTTETDSYTLKIGGEEE